MELQKLDRLDRTPALRRGRQDGSSQSPTGASGCPILLGWLVPGLGHWVIGRRGRAAFFAIQLIGMFVAGLVLSDFRCVSPFDRHPIWALTQIPGGVLTLVSAAATAGLYIERDIPLYSAGCLYVGAACLLNLVALCDLYDLTEPEQKRLARKAS